MADTPDSLLAETTYAALSGPVQLELEPRILKQGDMFAIFNPYGDIVASQNGEDGLF
jgi:hypothetical protein